MKLRHTPSTTRAFQPAVAQGNRKLICRRAAAVDASSSTVSVTTLEKLLSWAGSKGAATDKIIVSSDIEDASGILTATKEIPAGETVMSLPESTWLSHLAISKQPYGKMLSDLEPWLQLTIGLMFERSAGKSEWGAYVACMPELSSSPLFWTEEQLALLTGTQLEESLLGYRSFFQQTYQELASSLFSTNPAAFPAAGFSEERFMWAAACVRSRLHAPMDSPSAPIMVPLADMVAHRRIGNTQWKLKAGGLFNRSSSLVVEATRPIRQGEQLSMDFGAGKLDNTVLLDFGTMDRNVPQAGYNLTLSLLEDEKWADDKVDVLETIGMTTEMNFTLSPTGLISREMTAFLRLVHLSGMDGFLLEPILRAEVWGHMQEPISEENEMAVCQAISMGARIALESYPGSIMQDRDLLTSGKFKRGSREEQAVLIRLGEKESLDNVLRFFEDREENLHELEYYQERRLKRLGLLDGKGKSTYDGFFEGGIA